MAFQKGHSMPSPYPKPEPVQQNDDVSIVLLLGLAALLGAAGYFLFLFVSALGGLAQQLSDPAAIYETNATLLFATYPVFLALAYCFLPEFPDLRKRLRIARRIALLPTILLPLVLGFLLPTVASSAPWSFAATLFIVFSGIGVLPTLAVARLSVLWSPETRCTYVGDTYVDAEALSGDTKRIIAKRTNGTLRRPAALHRPALFGDGGRLTHRDVIQLIDLETDELDRLAAAADAATRVAMAEFRRKRAELLASASPEVALWVSERARASKDRGAVSLPPEDLA